MGHLLIFGLKNWAALKKKEYRIAIGYKRAYNSTVIYILYYLQNYYALSEICHMIRIETCCAYE